MRPLAEINGQADNVQTARRPAPRKEDRIAVGHRIILPQARAVERFDTVDKYVHVAAGAQFADSPLSAMPPPLKTIVAGSFVIV